MSNKNNTIIKISRSKYIEESLEVALIRLDNIFHYKGTPVMINYYTSDSRDSFDTVFASGVKDGVGRNCYRIISLRQDNIIWGAGSTLPDVSNLVHGEKYLYKDSSGDWWLVQIALDGRTRELVEIPSIPITYTCLLDNSQWVIGTDRKARRITDIYSKEEIDSLLDKALNTVKYIDFDQLTLTQREYLRGDQGPRGEDGETGPMGLQGPQGMRGFNGSADNLVVLSEEEYQLLEYKDPNKFYFTYETDELIPVSENTAYVEGDILVINGGVDSDILVLDSSVAYYDSSDLLIISGSSSSTSVSTPTFTPSPGTYSGSRNVEINCQTSGAEIHYTTNGNDPTINSPTYSIPLTLDSSCIIKAKAYKAGLIDSQISVARYDLLFSNTVNTPIIIPESGVYVNDRKIVSITCDTPEAIIRFTLDSTEPNETSPIYIGPFELSGDINVIRARGFKAYYNASKIATNVYRTEELVLNSPTFNISSGVYDESQLIIISTNNVGAVIRYTLDGTRPNSASPVYTSPLIISDIGTTVIKAICTKSGLVNSNVSTINITIQGTIPPTPPEPDGTIEVTDDTIIDTTENNSIIGDTWLVFNATVENNTLIF